MKPPVYYLLGIAVGALFVVFVPSPISADPPGLRINAEGTFTDFAGWMYRTPEGKFRNGPVMKGTNELLVPDAAQPGPGEEIVAISHFHHPSDTQGYPLHISLLEKSFANAKKIDLYLAINSHIWKYESGHALDIEQAVTASDRLAFKATGPTMANGAVPAEYQTAFDFSKGALSSIANLPDAQKDMAHYVVLFVDTDDTIWVEFAPLLAANEAPHLGCQTQLGRDMVFGYPKKSPPTALHGAPWLQCF